MVDPDRRANGRAWAGAVELACLTEMLGRHPFSAFKIDRQTFPLGKMFG